MLRRFLDAMTRLGCLLAGHELDTWTDRCRYCSKPARYPRSSRRRW